MAEVAYCGSCGKQIPAMANFCKHCGTDQASFKVDAAASTPGPAADPSPPQPVPPPETQPTPPAPPTAAAPPAATPAADPAAAAAQPEAAPPPPADAPPPPPSAREKAERVAPGVEDLAGQLATHLQAPGVAMAGLASLIGIAVCLAAGLVLAIALPNASFLAVGGGSGLLSETLAQAASFSQANLSFVGGGAVRTVPVLFVLIPILGVAAGTAALAPRTVGLSARERYLWAAAAGVPFAFLMLVVAVSLGKVEFDLVNAEMEFSAGSVFLLSLLWGALGGLLGMLFAQRQTGEATPSPLPEGPGRYASIAWSALRPLLMALLAIGVIGTLVWVVQVVRDDDYRQFPERSTVIAVGEQLAYAGDHAVDILPLGAGASERLAGWPAVPISQEEFFDLPSSPAADSASDYNLFDFNDTMPAFLFIPMLIVLIAIPALLALYAGFAVARRLDERRPDRAAAWGALVGPVWAIAMVLLTALARKDVVGNPTGDSVFIAFLLGGAVLGAVGGLLAAQGLSTGSPAAGPPPPPSPAPRGPA